MGEQYIVTAGTLNDGYEFWGPFETVEAAAQYGERFEKYLDGDWQISTLNAPEEG